MTTPVAVSAATASSQRPWHRQLNGYHWLVLAVCTLAWLFDCLNQQLFNLCRKPALADLLSTVPSDKNVAFYGSVATAALLIGWATGGIFFGVVADRFGRVKTLMIMILCYSLSTGLCGLTVGPWDFIAACFTTGLGVGGIFAVCCALVAESLPDGTRPQALGMLQAFSAFGNVGAGFISLFMIELWSHGIIATQWRWMFAVGIIPSLLAVIVVRKLHEPEAWKKAVAEGKLNKRRAGSLGELFGDPRWRRRAIVGLLLASSGVVGLWGIGVFSTDLTQSFIGREYEEEARKTHEDQKDLQFVAQVVASPEELKTAADVVQPSDLLGTSDKDVDARLMYGAALSISKSGGNVSAQSVLALLDQTEKDRQPQTAEARTRRARLLGAPAAPVKSHVERILARKKSRGIAALQWGAVTLIMFNLGAFCGIYAFSRLTQRIGRRIAFAIAFLAAGFSTALCFLYMSKRSDLFWMAPLMGGCQLSVFGGYAIYFPELFPTRLRSTGTSFCYNVGRYVAAAGALSIGLLTKYVFANTANPVDSLRYAGVAMCSCFLIGLLALPFAPETKGQPLPE
jgi:MFS family permease